MCAILLCVGVCDGEGCVLVCCVKVRDVCGSGVKVRDACWSVV